MENKEARRRLSPGEEALAQSSPGGRSAATAGGARAGCGTRVLGTGVHDWPFIRGGDQYSHAVMSGLMISEGRIDSYLIYPPGFHTMTAIVSRLSGLEPLELFPIVAPALSVLSASGVLRARQPALGQGLRADGGHALAGLLLSGPHESLAEARYPNILSADFLTGDGDCCPVRASTALSGARSSALLAILGSSVVLYHQVGSFYLALLLALVAALFVPFLLLTGRRSEAERGCCSTLGALGVLSVLFAWETYDLPSLIAGVLGGPSTRGGWHGRRDRHRLPGAPEPGPPARDDVASRWRGSVSLALCSPPGRSCAGGSDGSRRLPTSHSFSGRCVLFVGSRTALSGFPQRFERDLGLPLAVLGALALATILRSAPLRGPAVSRFSKLSAPLAAILVVGLVGLQAWQNLGEARGASRNVVSPEVAAAGAWLGDHSYRRKHYRDPLPQ